MSEDLTFCEIRDHEIKINNDKIYCRTCLHNELIKEARISLKRAYGLDKIDDECLLNNHAIQHPDMYGRFYCINCYHENLEKHEIERKNFEQLADYMEQSFKQY